MLKLATTKPPFNDGQGPASSNWADLIRDQTSHQRQPCNKPDIFQHTNITDGDLKAMRAKFLFCENSAATSSGQQNWTAF